MSSRPPSPEELEILHAKVAGFVSTYLRNGSSPSLSVRPMVHCPVMSSHYKVPLSGVNQIRFNESTCNSLSDAFPGWELVWLPKPDNSQMEYSILIPLANAILNGGGSRSKGKRSLYIDQGAAAAGGGISLERILVLFLVCMLLALGGYQFLLAPIFK